MRKFIMQMKHIFLGANSEMESEIVEVVYLGKNAERAQDFFYEKVDEIINKLPDDSIEDYKCLRLIEAIEEYRKTETEESEIEESIIEIIEDENGEVVSIKIESNGEKHEQDNSVLDSYGNWVISK